jgi:hypothetical protein
MEFDPSDKLAEMATALSSLVTSLDELLADPAPSVDKQTLGLLRQSLEEPSRLFALLEERRESGARDEGP